MNKLINTDFYTEVIKLNSTCPEWGMSWNKSILGENRFIGLLDDKFHRSQFCEKMGPLLVKEHL